jgi:uncharacterized protein (DUF58 family)
VTPTTRLLVLTTVTLPLSLAPLMRPELALLVLAGWFAALVALAVDAAALARSAPAVEVEHAGSAAVGRAVRVKVRAELGGARRVDVQLAATAPLVAPGVRRERVPAPAGIVEIEVDAPKRGRGRIERAHVRVYGPLGLLARDVVTEHGCGDVRVIPDVEAVDQRARELVGAQPLLSGAKREPWTGEGREFESLQAYATGMDVRAIDWKSSARHQSLRVRRYHVERRQRIVLSFDTGRAMGDPLDGLERLDHAIHAGLVLAKAALHAGDLVGMHAYGGAPRAWVPLRSGAAQGGLLRRACADLAVDPVDANHVHGLHDLLLRVRRRSMVAVFTEFSDANTAELMVEVLGQLARRHVVVFVAMADPALEAPLTADPRTAEVLARAVLANSLAERREWVLTRLAGLGVHVVRARAGAAAGALVERYVRVKARGLIG